MNNFTYPADLYNLTKAEWRRKVWPRETVPALPDKDTFQKIIDVVYHASFLTEERRRIWFRVVYVSKEAIIKTSKRLEDTRVVEFTSPRPFDVNELVKLAPAADPTQVLIGVYEGDSGELEIWGLIEAGTSWWEFQRHETSGASPPPNAFTLCSKKPGQINMSRSGSLVLILDQGRIVKPSWRVFYQGPVADFLERGAQELYQEVCKRLNAKCYDPEGDDDDYPKRAYVFLLQRVLNRIRERFHGGTLIVIPDTIDVNDTRLKDRIVIKYPCYYDDAWEALVNELVKHRDYYDLHFKLWDKKQIEQDEYRQCDIEQSHYEEAEEMVKRAVGFLSSLAAVDGAVVITDKLRLLGFGAEIVASSPSLTKVKMITEFRKGIGDFRDIEFFGTRHRSAFRFCSSFEDSVAFIVSQDGETKVAKRVGSEVILWTNIDVGALGF